MAISPKRVCWDACAWIALIQKEKIRDDHGTVTEDRETACKVVLDEAKSGNLEIVTSSLCLVEVCKNTQVRGEGEDKIASFFENDYILMMDLDTFVGERARDLMLAGLPGLKPPDAIHLATAALSNAEELHTFDRKLLRLDGRVTKADGSKLRVRKPDAGGRAPLLVLMNAPSDESTDDFGELTEEQLDELSHLDRDENEPRV